MTEIEYGAKSADGRVLRATAQPWLVLADRIAQAEAIEAPKAKGK